VSALEQALVSSETALQSNRVGYEVGVRINIDVLNAQQQVFQTKRDLARARYDTIINGLKLKAAAGALSEADVEEVNRLLGTEQPKPKTSAAPAPLAGAAPAELPAAFVAAVPATPEPVMTAPQADAPKADAAPEKARSEPKATKASGAKKTAGAASTKAKTVARKTAEPSDAPAEARTVALTEPAPATPVGAPVAPGDEGMTAAPEGSARVVKFVEPKVPGAE
jgi:hypothetical protein